jgi:hypothetical protein
MATNYTTGSNKAQANPKFLQEGTVTVCAIFPLSAALAINDTIVMMVLPLGATVVDAIISSDTPLDTNAASTLSFQVGDAVLATRYIGTHVQGNNQAMAPYNLDQASGHQYVVVAGTQQIIIKVQAAPATPATTGNLRLTMQYSMDP